MKLSGELCFFFRTLQSTFFSAAMSAQDQQNVDNMYADLTVDTTISFLDADMNIGDAQEDEHDNDDDVLIGLADQINWMAG